jgi:hypothetical protein
MLAGLMAQSGVRNEIAAFGTYSKEAKITSR